MVPLLLESAPSPGSHFTPARTRPSALCAQGNASHNTAAPELGRAWDIRPANRFKKTQTTTTTNRADGSSPRGLPRSAGGAAGPAVKAGPPRAPAAAANQRRERPLLRRRPLRRSSSRCCAGPRRRRRSAMWLLAASVLLGALHAGECPPHPPSCLLSPALVVLTAPAAAAAIAPRRIACGPGAGTPAVSPVEPPGCEGRAEPPPGPREGEGRVVAAAAGGGLSRGRRGGAGAARPAAAPAAWRGDSGLSCPELPAPPAGSPCVCGQPGLRVRSGRSPSFGKERGHAFKHTHATHAVIQPPPPPLPTSSPGPAVGCSPQKLRGRGETACPELCSSPPCALGQLSSVCFTETATLVLCCTESRVDSVS